MAVYPVHVPREERCLCTFHVREQLKGEARLGPDFDEQAWSAWEKEGRQAFRLKFRG